MMLPQQVRNGEVFLFIQIPDEDRFRRLERAPWGRPQICGQGRGAHDTLPPAETGGDQEVRFPAAIPQHLDMIDLHGPRDLLLTEVSSIQDQRAPPVMVPGPRAATIRNEAEGLRGELASTGRRSRP